MLFWNISTNTVVEFGNRCFFKDFQIVVLGLLSYLVVGIINPMIIFLSNFPFLSSFFYYFFIAIFLKFSENYNKETV